MAIGTERLSVESAQRIARAIKAEVANDTEYFVVLVPNNGPVAFLAEFAPKDAAQLFRDIAADVEDSTRDVETFDVKDH